MRDKATSLHEELRRLLLKFPKNGQHFEFLITRAIETALGQRVWRARAGSQFGADMGTAASDGPAVKVEAKRYEHGSQLKARELRGEIAEAIDSSPSLDLWILATCAEVPEQIQIALKRESERRGIGIEIMDLSPSPHCKMPRLLLETRDAIIPFVRDSLGGAAADEMASLLGRYRRRLSCDGRPLLNPERLFDLAAERARVSFGEALTQAVVARSRFGQRLHDQTFVARETATANMDRWRASADPPASMLVVCGEEGDGKTWAASAWLARFAAQHKSLPVYLSSREASGLSSIETGISAFLHGLFPETEEAHWKRRVQRWLSTPSITARLILVLDGLNEQPTAPWRRLLDTLFVPDDQPSSVSSTERTGRAKFPMIVTCRTVYWKTHFPEIPEWRVELAELGPFSTPELRTFLQQHGRQPDEFSPEVWQLLKKPRYSGLVIQHYERLLQSSDITIDRLLYEDWKHRCQEKSDFPLDDNRFQHLLRELAVQSLQGRQTHRFRELREFLPADNSERIFTELVTGGVLTEGPSGYKVVPPRLCHALGLLLLSQLIQIPDEESMAEVLGAYLEPSGLDAHSSILTAAIFGASLTNAPPAVLRLLFRSLFSLQNFGADVWRRIQAYFPAFPEIYRELAEELVASPRLDRNALQAIESSYYRWCDHDRFSDLIARHAYRWLALIPMQSPWERDQEHYEQRLTQLFGAPFRAGRVAIEGMEFHFMDSPHLPRLHTLAFGVLSARSTKIAPKALAQWAIVDNLQRFSPITADWWIVRFLDNATLSGLVAEIEKMLTIDSPIWQEAAFHLAGTLPNKRAADLQWRSTYSPPTSLFERWHADDPCKTGAYFWRSSDCHACLERSDIDAGVKANNLAHHANDPAFRLPQSGAESIRAQLRGLLANTDPAELYGPEVTTTRHDLEHWTPGFARWIPRELARASRHQCEFFSETSLPQIDGVTGAAERRELPSYDLERITMILGRQDSQRLRRFWEHWIRLPLELRVTRCGDKIDVVESDVFRVLLLCTDSDEQRELIKMRATTAFSDRRLIDALPLGMGSDELRVLRDQLFTDRDHLVTKLFLLSLDTVTLTTEQRALLVQIAREKARDDSGIHVRIFALLSADQELVRMLLDAKVGLLFEFVSEAYWVPSAAIPPKTPFAELTAISPPLLSHILEDRPNPEDDLAFAATLREFAASDDSTLQWRATPRSWCPFSLASVRRALAADPQLTEDLLARLEAPDLSQRLENSYWLYHALCAILLESASQPVENLLDHLISHSHQAHTSDVTSPRSILTLMARHQDHPAVPPRLAFWLNQCVTDAALQSYSLSFVPTRDTWLWKRITSDLTSDRPILVARALTLAGFAHDSDRAALVLAAQANRTSRWLDYVRLIALDTSTRDQRARHWFTAFISRRGAAESWAAFQLFLTCIDRRFETWLSPTLQSHGLNYRGTIRAMRHLRVNHQRIQEKIDKVEKNLKSRFCHQQIDTGLFPWRSDWRLSSVQIESLITGEASET